MIVGTNICFVVVPCSNNHCWNNCFNNDSWNKHLFRGCSVLARFVIGYGGGGTKKVLGVGTSPLGQPDHFISWADYKGATKSLLSSGQVTEIIVSLLVAAGIDPATHVAEVEDHTPDEKDNNTVEIEEHFVQMQEGPLVEENDGEN